MDESVPVVNNVVVIEDAAPEAVRPTIGLVEQLHLGIGGCIRPSARTFSPGTGPLPL